MFLRVTRSRIDPAKSDQVASLAQNVIDAVKKLPGFQNAYQAGDAATGRAVSVTIWDTREHAQFDRAALGDIVSRVQSMGAQMEAPEIYEVNVQA